MKLFNYLQNSFTVKLALIISIIAAISCGTAVYFLNNLKQKVVEEMMLQKARGIVMKDFADKLEMFNRETKQQINSLQTVRPSEDEILTFIEKVEKLDQDIVIKHSGQGAASGGNAVDFDIELKGTFEETINFLKSLEQDLPYLVDITSIAYDASGQHSQGAGVTRMKIILFIE